jgi:ribosomal RNA assembly protein
MEEPIKVPKERIAALIGRAGKTKKQIEKLTGTRLHIESATGSVIAEGDGPGLYNALSIVKAIARGFAPEKALLLSSSDYYLDLIDISEIVGKSRKEIEVKKGRVIGKSGAARQGIENATGCFISVFGKTVAIIGQPENVEKARKAVEMLLKGARHATVKNFLKREELAKKRFEL